MLPALNQKAADCGFFFSPVHAADLPELCDIRVEAMRESLERLGRFNLTRARARLADDFVAEQTYWINTDTQKKQGFLVLQPANTGLHLAHLYLRLTSQGQGLGGSVLFVICQLADAQVQPIRLNALVGSRANKLYLKHGFKPLSEDAIDVFYQRPPVLLSSRSS
jgi:GNAT superfamily N-acetyltransferase